MWRTWHEVERDGEGGDEIRWIDIDQAIKRLDDASGLSFSRGKLIDWGLEHDIRQRGDMVDEDELTEQLFQASLKTLWALTND